MTVTSSPAAVISSTPAPPAATDAPTGTQVPPAATPSGGEDEEDSATHISVGALLVAASAIIAALV